MTDSRPPRRSFLEELKTRRVYRVAALYVVVAFALLQGADLVLPAFNAPDWAFRVLVLVSVAGFFVAVALGWIFDLTPSGLERTDSGRMVSGPAATFLQRSLVGVVALAAVGATGVMVWRATRSAAPVQQSRIMVFPLVVSGAGLAAEVGEDVATMIGHALDGTGPLRWIDGWPLLDVQAREDVRRLTLPEAQQLAAQRECGHFLTGRVVQRGDSTVVLLELRSTATGEDVAKGEASGTASDPWRVGLRAVTGIVEHLIPTRLPNVEAGFSDRPPEAVARFLLGEQSYRRAGFEEALEHFTAAFEADPTFALAAIRGAQAASWEHDVGSAGRLIDAALLLELAPRERLFTEGIRHYLDGDAEAAVAALRGALAQDSLMGVAWAQLGEVYRHLAPMEAPDDAAQIAFERAFAQDRSAAYVLYHLLEGVIRKGDVARAGALLGEFRALGSDADLQAQLSYMHECVASGAGTVPPARLQQWARERPLDLLVAAGQLAAQGRQLPCAETLYLGLLTGDTATDAAWRGRYRSAAMGLGWSLLARDATAEAELLLVTAVRSYPAFHALLLRARPTDTGVRLPAEPWTELPVMALDDGGVNPLAPFLPVLLQAGAVHPELKDAAWNEARRWLDADPAALERTTSSTTLWLYGVLAARTDALDAAAAARGRLAEVGSGGTGDAVPLEVLDAHVALARGDTADALARLSRMHARAERSSIAWSLTSPLGFERLTLAGLLLRRGDAGRAAAVAAAFDGAGPFVHPLFVRQSLEIRREAAAVRGLRAEAATYEARLRTLTRPAEGAN